MSAIRHVGITVNNLEKMKEFYQVYFGFSVLKEARESGSVISNFSAVVGVDVTTCKMVNKKSQMIEFLEYIKPASDPIRFISITNNGISHIAFKVEDLDLLYGVLQNTVSFNYPPQLSPDGKVKIAFCRDVEGNLLELVEEL